MSFKSYLNESKDKKMKMGDTVVILTGKTMMKADLKHYKVLVPWTDEQKKKREKTVLDFFYKIINSKFFWRKVVCERNFEIFTRNQF